MSRAARSLFFFSIYMMAVGALLTLVPNFLLGLLRLPETNEVYIRIVGMMVFILGFYYLNAARNEIQPFFRWSVYGRLAGFAMFCILPMVGLGPPVLILFGAIDGAAALWTHRCLKAAEDNPS